MTIEKAEEIIDNIYQEKMIDLSTEIEFTELEEASVRVLREELILKKKIEELKEINKEHQLLNGELAFKLGKLEEEIEELKIINNMQKYRIEVIDERELIPKSKIENKIKKLEEDFEEADEKTQIEFEEIQENVIKVLKELLEEG